MFEPLNHDRLIRSKHRLAATTRGALEKLRRQHADDPEFRRLVGATRKPDARAATDTDAVTYWTAYDPTADAPDIADRAKTRAASYGSGRELDAK